MYKERSLSTSFHKASSTYTLYMAARNNIEKLNWLHLFIHRFLFDWQHFEFKYMFRIYQYITLYLCTVARVSFFLNASSMYVWLFFDFIATNKIHGVTYMGTHSLYSSHIRDHKKYEWYYNLFEPKCSSMGENLLCMYWSKIYTCLDLYYICVYIVWHRYFEVCTKSAV